MALPSLDYGMSNKWAIPPFRLLISKSKAPKRQTTMDEEPHIGHLIKAELARRGLTITWLAGQLGCSRQNAYKIFSRKWIYTDLLLKICDLLDYDFFKCYSDWRNARKKE